ncbi:hypothetical protein CALVIDRAFT_430995 [Calocera viscosa TUFC12733]|uniref:Uncharacterized protein n=1 Tax=Calocera viscosa (strain TUFC12733) TaxID=1330018 RepID=A0A167FZB0_CALVF|nr:hypothetical protein CALVIDRAFT_430995 [Calocera viscosa TUFC12733]
MGYKTRKASSSTIRSMAAALRCPTLLSVEGNSGVLRQAILERLYPVLAAMMHQYPLPVFGKTFGADVDASDAFFKSHFVFNDVVLPDRDDALKDALRQEVFAPVDHTFVKKPASALVILQRLPHADELHPGAHSSRPLTPELRRDGQPGGLFVPIARRPTQMIETNFALDHPASQKVPFPRGDAGSWTREERLRATAAPEWVGVEDAARQLADAFDQPGQRRGNSYVIIQPLQEKDICIMGRKGPSHAKMQSLVCYLVARGSAPCDLKGALWPRTMRALQEKDLRTDSSKNNLYTFRSFSYWNRYSQRGFGTDYMQQPNSFLVGGNIHTRTPRPSMAIVENAEGYESLLDIWQPWFNHATETVRCRLRQEYRLLEDLVQQPTLNTQLPCYPFPSFVVNIHCCVTAHRDDQDPDGGVCVLLVFGNFKGGQLVLYEPGLVLKVEAGDMVIFPSMSLTHFTLHFQGRRGTIVMHGDRSWEGWQQDYNGWAVE